MNISERKGNIMTKKKKYGKVQVKVCRIGEEVRAYPEYASVLELCKTHNMSFQKAWRIASAAADTVEK